MMNSKESTKRLVLEHIKKYRKALPIDVFKYIYQSVYGCEHFVTDEKAVIEGIKMEYQSMGLVENEGICEVEDLDGDYFRLPLCRMNSGLKAETLGRLFFLSSKTNGEKAEREKQALIEEKISAVLELTHKGELPFNACELNIAIEKWRNEGFCAVRHSDMFRECYKPSYRVIAKKYMPFIEVFAKIDSICDKRQRAVVAIDGGCASGKTTFASMLEVIYDCNIFHMDDFFLQPHQRTQERLEEIGGNVDRERFLEQVLLPLSKNETVYYQKYDCSKKCLSQPVAVQPKALTVIEGGYCMHGDLSPYYDYSIFFDVSKELQKQRIIKRESPQSAQRFFDMWMPLEQRYFDGMMVKSRCDTVVEMG